MADLRELTTDAKRLYDALGDLLAKQEAASQQDEIDFNAIWFGAKSRPFTGHVLVGQEDVVRQKYVRLLSAMLELAENPEIRLMQIRFLGRILAAFSKENCLREVVADGKLLTAHFIEEFQEMNTNDLSQALLVDMFLMIYLPGQVEAKQLDFAVGFLALLGPDRQVTEALSQVVKGILIGDDEQIAQQLPYVDVNLFRCYMQVPYDVPFAYDLRRAQGVSGKLVFRHVIFQGLPRVNLDEYAAQEIIFEQCRFEDIQGITKWDERKALHFVDCEFNQCDIQENLLSLQNATMKNCSFDQIKAVCTDKYILQLAGCQCEGLHLQDIFIQHKDCGGLLRMFNSNIKDIVVEHLDTALQGNPSYRYIIVVYRGQLLQAKIIDWRLSGDSYVLVKTADATVDDVDFASVSGNHSVWNVNSCEGRIQGGKEELKY
jgi:hypothetical protein